MSPSTPPKPSIDRTPPTTTHYTPINKPRKHHYISRIPRKLLPLTIAGVIPRRQGSCSPPAPLSLSRSLSAVCTAARASACTGVHMQRRRCAHASHRRAAPARSPSGSPAVLIEVNARTSASASSAFHQGKGGGAYSTPPGLHPRQDGGSTVLASGSAGEEACRGWNGGKKGWMQRDNRTGRAWLRGSRGTEGGSRVTRKGIETVVCRRNQTERACGGERRTGRLAAGEVDRARQLERERERG